MAASQKSQDYAVELLRRIVPKLEQTELSDVINVLLEKGEELGVAQRPQKKGTQ